jgi:hypothetical protein
LTCVDGKALLEERKANLQRANGTLVETPGEVHEEVSIGEALPGDKKDKKAKLTKQERKKLKKEERKRETEEKKKSEEATANGGIDQGSDEVMVCLGLPWPLDPLGL